MFHFRHIKKRRTDLLLPMELDDRIRAVRGRRSISELVTSAICQYLGLDPTEFGLNADHAGHQATAAGAPAATETGRHVEAGQCG